MAKNTSNYNLKKPSSEDFYNVEDQNGNMDIIDQELKRLNEDNQNADQKISSVKSDLSSHLSDIAHVPHLGTTSNAGNVYSITTAKVIGVNQKFTIRFNVPATGPATLKISTMTAAAPIKKTGLVDAVVKLGYYTLFWDGANFQLLGEGGDIPKLPNLIRNGNFKFNINGWTSNNATASVLNNVLTFTPSFIYGGILQTVKQPLPGDKVYIRCNMKGSLLSRFIFYYKDGYGNPVLSPSAANTWQTLSEIATYSNDGDKAVIAFDDAASSGWSHTQIKNVIYFNLTQIFGKGNEPTKAEIDSIMDGGINKFSSRGFYIRHGLNAFSRENENSFWIRCDTGATYAFVDYPLTLKANTTYRLKATTIGANAVSAGTIIITSRDYSTQYGGGMPGNVNFTFTTPSDGMVSAIFYANSDSSSTTNPEASFINVSITEGSNDLPFVPYKPTDWWDSDIASLVFDSTALVGDVLAGKVFYGADGYRAVGTIPNRTFAANGGSYTPASSWKADGGGALTVRPQEGYYKNEVNGNEFGPIIMNDPNFIPANIVNGKNIFGLAGTYSGRRYVEGRGLSSSSAVTKSFNYDTGGTISLSYILLGTLGFLPSFIELYAFWGNKVYRTLYSAFQKMGAQDITKIAVFSYDGGFTFIQLTGNAYVTASGIQLPVYEGGAPGVGVWYDWRAIE